jgi:(p)ppGpp synthase/HD superfamily hydrolase
MRELVIHAHGAQTRNGGRVPYALHVLSVGTIVEDAVELGGELSDPQLRHDLYLAALGHDLYEDTAVTREHVCDRFGERVDRLIEGMTNRKGDHDRAGYLAQLRDARDEVRLIKRADLIDNATSCAYGIHDLTRAWVATTFVPIAHELVEVLGPPRGRYARTEALLASWTDFAMRRLDALLDATSVLGVG